MQQHNFALLRWVHKSSPSILNWLSPRGKDVSNRGHDAHTVGSREGTARAKYPKSWMHRVNCRQHSTMKDQTEQGETILDHETEFEISSSRVAIKKEPRRFVALQDLPPKKKAKTLARSFGVR